MRIGQLAEQAGVTTKTVRFYEDERLLPMPRRTPSGYRDYDPGAMERLAFIRDAQAAGLTLRQIRQVLDIRDGGEPPCEHVGRLIENRLVDVEQRIVELEHTRSRLRDLARRTAALDPADCHGYCQIIETQV
jgi:DNA-binding transcriptional MerR regulator